MKKKILSAVAAGAVAVGMIGCGGGGSGSTKTTDTTQPTTVKGIDGYVMNAKVVVKYWNADENKTESVTLQNKDNYYLTVDITTNKPKKGSPDYSLKELNSTVLNNVVSVALQQQSQGTLDDNSVYAPSFFDANNDGKYNSKDGDLFIPVGVELKAPKGFSVVTPVTTIIAAKVEEVLNEDVLVQKLKDSKLQESAAETSKQIEEIRDAALSLRMVQIGETFNKFRFLFLQDERRGSS